MPTTPKTETSPPTRLLTIAEVRHVRRLVHEKRIPYIKWGHLLRFDPTDIANWIDTYRRCPNGPGAKR
jgi:excisionase family DNA binding protein